MFAELLTFNDIKAEPFVKEHILWDKEPKDLMEPKFKVTPEGTEFRGAIKGYIFYIETMNKEPQLFLMRHTAAEYGETLARIDEIPQALLLEAIEENKQKAYFKMYPINKTVQDWLKKELDLAN
ncbi:MAG: DVU0772 family protein [Dissulfurispiraceae bacterium]